MANESEKITPVPTPFSFGLGSSQMPDGSKIALLRFDTVLGEIHLMMPIDAMQAMGAQLQTHAINLRASNLTVANIQDLTGLLKGL